MANWFQSILDAQQSQFLSDATAFREWRTSSSTAWSESSAILNRSKKRASICMCCW